MISANTDFLGSYLSKLEDYEDRFERAQMAFAPINRFAEAVMTAINEAAPRSRLATSEIADFKLEVADLIHTLADTNLRDWAQDVNMPVSEMLDYDRNRRA